MIAYEFHDLFPSLHWLFIIVDGWVKGRKILYLPIPKYIGSGAHESQGFKYRFMVMERFGDDIEKLFNAAGRKFEIKTVCYLAIRLVSQI